MNAGEIRNQIDQIWNNFWTGGISNPLEVIERVTCLIFIRRLDGLFSFMAADALLAVLENVKNHAAA